MTRDYNIPAEIEIEKLIISACLQDTEAISRISSLMENDFYDANNRTLFGAIKAVFNSGEDVTVTSVWEHCVKHHLDKQFPLDAIMQYSTYVLSSAEVTRHAEIVKERSQRRKILSISNIANLAATDLGVSTDEILSKVQESVDTIQDESAGDIPTMNGIIANIRLKIQLEESGIDVNIRTGFHFTDDQGGLHPTDLVTIGAYPAVGKSALTAKMAYNMAMRGVSVAYYSLEMPAEQIACRMCAFVSEQQSVCDGCSRSLTVSQTISNMPIRTKEQTNLYLQLLDEMSNLPLHIVDSRNSIEELTASIGEMVRKAKVKVVFIDYVQLIQNKSRMTREEHLGECCKILKSTAKRYDICIILLTQLTQNSDKGDRRPHYYNAKGASSIYEASDLFITLDRPEADDVSDKTSPRGYEGKFGDITTNNTAEVKICKNKNGRTDSYLLMYSAPYTDFTNVDDMTTLVKHRIF